MKFYLTIVFLALKFFCSAQSWKELGTGYFDAVIPMQLYADTANNNLFTFGTDTNVFSNNTLQNWYTSTGIFNIIGNNGAIAYKNKKNLYFKFFYENNNNSKPRTALVRFSTATDLDTVAVLTGDWVNGGYAYYNGNLVVVLGSVAGATISYSGLAEFNGTTFNAIGKSTWGVSEGYPNQCAVYNGELYAAGGIDSSLQVLKSSGWRMVYPGIHGASSSISKLLVYNKRLYVIGGFWKFENSNNPGNSIAAWDGTKWDSLGGGASNEFIPINAGFDDAVVCNGKLYVVGGFTSVSGVKGKRIMCWNDTSWCWVGKDLDSTSGRLWRIECLNDTIYASGNFDKVNGKNLGVVGKLFNMSLKDSCSSSFYSGFNHLIKNSDITIYPNPSSTILHIKTDQYFDEATKIEIANSLGQVVMNTNYNSEIDVSLLNSGMYIIKLITPNKQQFHSNFVKME